MNSNYREEKGSKSTEQILSTGIVSTAGISELQAVGEEPAGGSGN